MKLIADLHIHSRYSRSTSRDLVPEHLDAWARLKGLTVVGTGDFTHPAWLRELEEKLAPAEPGLFVLKDPPRNLPEVLASPGGPPVRFLLTAEISSIYKRGDRVRKVHNLLLAPDLEAARRIQAALARIGNVASDGRPILGLDSRDLLETLLECSPGAALIPAHIWTPWFSALGSQSGFDSIEECYRDLADQVFAVETGLSSDPSMNGMCSFLDRYTLISNSDAHSPENLGREANLLDIELAYPALLAALRAGGSTAAVLPGVPGAGFLGTAEFFPQEGKYHFDGHRRCGIRWDPLETMRHQGLCPACGRPVTVGVLHRVVQLADRGVPAHLPGRPPFRSLIPLRELLAEILGTGAQSRRVGQAWQALVRKAGPELTVLLDLPLEEIRAAGGERLAEAVRRMRAGEVRVEEGYDGEYGRIRVFREGEQESLSGQELLFRDLARAEPPRPAGAGPAPEPAPADPDGDFYRELLRSLQAPPAPAAAASGALPPAPTVPPAEQLPLFASVASFLKSLNPEQREAAEHGEGPALVIAGPGTGKTQTLTCRIARLVQDLGIEPESLLAITFTNKAAGEMRDRVRALLGSAVDPARLRIETFHAFGLSLLQAWPREAGRGPRFRLLDEEERERLLAERLELPAREARRAARAFSRRKQADDLAGAAPDPDELFPRYERLLAELDAFDLDDLVQAPLRLLHGHPEMLAEVRRRVRWVLVDEAQDLNPAQYRLLRTLLPDPAANLFLIGDPDQAIYGFRGADPRLIGRLAADYPACRIFRLRTSYRCSGRILQASRQVLQDGGPPLQGQEEGVRIQVLEQATERSEAEFVARTIETMLGGVSFFSIDSRVSDGGRLEGVAGLSDFAVLCRIGRQMEPLEKALRDHAIPFQVVGEVPFFRQEPARTLIDLLRLVTDPENRPLLRDLLERRGISLAMLEETFRLARESGSLRGTLTGIARTFLPGPGEAGAPSGAVAEDLQRLVDLAAGFGGDLAGFLRYVTLGSAADAFRAKAEQVSLMTLHAAKGLEFPCVFIVGCEEGLLPYTLFGGTEAGGADAAEEGRLLYVGMTRARRFLFLSHARRRFLFGRELQLERSSLLDRIEGGLTEQSRVQVRRKKAAAEGRQLDLF